MMGEATIVFATQATIAGCPICPDILWRLVALIHSMRLSLMKGAHADLSSTACQEIGVKPSFSLSGIPRLLVVEVLTPLMIGVADHAHDVTAGVQREGTRLTHQFDFADLIQQMIAFSAIAGV